MNKWAKDLGLQAILLKSNLADDEQCYEIMILRLLFALVQCSLILAMEHLLPRLGVLESPLVIILIAIMRLFDQICLTISLSKWASSIWRHSLLYQYLYARTRDFRELEITWSSLMSTQHLKIVRFLFTKWFVCVSLISQRFGLSWDLNEMTKEGSDMRCATIVFQLCSKVGYVWRVGEIGKTNGRINSIMKLNFVIQ